MARRDRRCHFHVVKEEGLRRLHALVRDHPDFEVLDGESPSRYSFRFVPHSLSERLEEPGMPALIDRLNREIADSLAGGGRARLAVANVQGRIALCLAASGQDPLADEVDRAFEAIAQAGRRLALDVLAARRSVAAQEETC